MISYLLSKLLPLLLLPLGFSLFFLLVGVIFRWRWSSSLAFALLWIFSLGIVSQGLWRVLEAPWQRRLVSSAPRADAIVVLSGGFILPRALLASRNGLILIVFLLGWSFIRLIKLRGCYSPVDLIRLNLACCLKASVT